MATETALTLISPPDLRLPETEETNLSALVEKKIEETKTLTMVSTDKQFEAAGEELKAIAQLRSHLERAIRPYITF